VQYWTLEACAHLFWCIVQAINLQDCTWQIQQKWQFYENNTFLVILYICASRCTIKPQKYITIPVDALKDIGERVYSPNDW
jgi:hypothetical protein